MVGGSLVEAMFALPMLFFWIACGILAVLGAALILGATINVAVHTIIGVVLQGVRDRRAAARRDGDAADAEQPARRARGVSGRS